MLEWPGSPRAAQADRKAYLMNPTRQAPPSPSKWGRSCFSTHRSSGAGASLALSSGAKRGHALARLGLSLLLCTALGLSGCNRARQPVTLPIPAVTQVPIPLPFVPADDSLFGYLRVRDPLALLRALSSLSGGERLEALALARGWPLTDLKPGAGAALFVWDPAGQPLAATPVAAVLPVASSSALATRLHRAAGDGLVRGDGGGTLAALNPPGLARATAAGPALWQVAASQDPADVLLYVNLAGLLDRYGAQARSALRAASALGLSGATPTPGQPSPKATMAMLERLLDRLNTVKATSLSLSLSPEAVELATVVQERAGGTGGRGPVAAPDLTRLLPAAEVRLQWNARDLKRWVREYWEVYGALWSEQPALQAQLKSTLDEWAQVTPQAEMAVAVTLRPQVRAYLISKVADAGAALRVMRRAAASISSAGLQERYREQGLRISVTVEPALRKLQGWPVDRYRYQVAVVDPGKVPAAARALFERLNGATYEAMQLGPYLVASFNDPLDVLAADVVAGRGGGALRARRVYPAGAVSYGDVDLEGLWAGVKALLPPEAGARLPAPPPHLGVATWFSYEGDQAALYRVQLPRTLLGLLGAR